MKCGFATTPIMLAMLGMAEAVYAHPGHVPGPGPVHGFSWLDVLGFLVASVALPAAAFLAGKLHSRRRR